MVAGLAALGLSHALVEIGGEVATLGRHPSGRAWRLAIEAGGRTTGDGAAHGAPVRPGAGNIGPSPQGLRGRVETSHVIDPRQGRPAAQGLAQVSVLASTACARMRWPRGCSRWGRMTARASRVRRASRRSLCIRAARSA
ncbi:hypothetical protein MBELCI_3646 [Limimaricola cinnabarinus LL-001]|uniref:FAD:protein FMN transferase n=2 Tax=Limimaricola cinnabarinus TaxID=1125964 RepID=U3AIT8_9RHOB|nr:hypothetical protein MBELCI_3646 [Limimaricola cinnabarinus LL-001]